jgi:hypothetical protein
MDKTLTKWTMDKTLTKYLQLIVSLNLVSNRRPEKCGFQSIKRRIHRFRFTFLSCDLNRISQEFPELISTELVE